MKLASQPGFDDDVLLTLLAFTDEMQEWADTTAARTANALLSQYFNANNTKKERFITEAVLQQYLRRLFSQSKPSTVTASGRKAEYVDTDTRGHGIPDDSAQTKPWKYTDLRAVPAVAWAVNEADVRLFHAHTPILHKLGVSTYMLTQTRTAKGSTRRTTLAALHPRSPHPGRRRHNAHPSPRPPNCYQLPHQIPRQDPPEQRPRKSL